MKTTYFWLICVCFIMGVSLILCDGKLEKRQQKTTVQCSIDTFNCSNGICIDELLVCNGYADCSNGLDETQSLCTQLFPTCPNYSFRCKYGACINKNARCNGKKDCVDGSDEIAAECTPLTCKEDEYKCKSGQCIDIIYTCDGNSDCSDGSDETVALCQTVHCPNYSFKCKYGACVHKTSKCDGVKQCIDGSDEAANICGPPIHSKPSKPPTSVPSTSVATQTSCTIPNSEGSIYSFTNENQKDILPPGHRISVSGIVYENCKEGYHKVERSKLMVCREGGQWEPRFMEKLCFKDCPPLASDTLELHCTLNDRNVNCSNPSVHGTILRPKCKASHGLPNGREETPIEVTCLPDGKWSEQLYKCVPLCGEPYIKNQVLIYKGKVAEYGTSPWNVGIYRNNIMICGGTLISQILAISAAHCFWDEELQIRSLSNTGIYKIAVGKYARDISIKDNDFTQIINVKSISIKSDFYGLSDFYAKDIAIIVLETKVKISNVVLPVCIDWNKKYNVTTGTIGKVVGWGNTELQKPSPNLLEANLPYYEQSLCRNMYKNGFERYVTIDKFCAGSTSTTGPGVLEGDSGAGLTFEINNLYYLIGVVSVKDPNTNNSMAVFTNVRHHITWIKDFYIGNPT